MRNSTLFKIENIRSTTAAALKSNQRIRSQNQAKVAVIGEAAHQHTDKTREIIVAWGGRRMHDHHSVNQVRLRIFIHHLVKHLVGDTVQPECVGHIDRVESEFQLDHRHHSFRGPAQYRTAVSAYR